MHMYVLHVIIAVELHKTETLQTRTPSYTGARVIRSI